MRVRVHCVEWLIKVTLFLISLLLPLSSLLSSCLAPSASSYFFCLLPFISAHASHCLSLGSSFSLSIILPTASNLSHCSFHCSVGLPSLIAHKLFGIKKCMSAECKCGLCTLGRCMLCVCATRLSFCPRHSSAPTHHHPALWAVTFLLPCSSCIVDTFSNNSS